MGAAIDDHDLEALAGRIGAAVRELRLGQRWSLGDLARASGLSKTILARIERGDGNPSVETLWRGLRWLAASRRGPLLPPPRSALRARPPRSRPPPPSRSGMRGRMLLL